MTDELKPCPRCGYHVVRTPTPAALSETEIQDRVLHDMGNPQPKERKQWLREYLRRINEYVAPTPDAPQGAPETTKFAGRTMAEWQKHAKFDGSMCACSASELRNILQHIATSNVRIADYTHHIKEIERQLSIAEVRIATAHNSH